MTSTFKAAVKAIAPAPLRDLWKKFRLGIEEKRIEGHSLDEIFAETYAKRKWGASEGQSPFFSGVGSLPDATAEYEAFLASYIERHPEIETLVDVGCGDFQVGRRLLARLSRPITYIGCDIAKNVVAYNTQAFARPGVSFMALDITRERPPAGDLVTVREVLQHLSNADIHKALANLSQRFARAAITEAIFIEPSAPNLDMVSGHWTRDRQRSGVYLDLPPFNLTVIEESRKDYESGEAYRTTVVALPGPRA